MKQENRVFLDDNGKMTCKHGDTVHWIHCLTCNELVIAKEIYVNQDVVCPHCKNKFKVRIYKNQTIKLSKR